MYQHDATSLEYLSDEQIQKAMTLSLTEDDFWSSRKASVGGRIFDADAYWAAVTYFYWFFCAQFIKITDKRRQTVPFIFNNPQRLVEIKTLKQILRYGFCHMWIMKSRQIGMSLVCAVRAVWCAFFYAMNATIYAAEKDEQAMQLIFPYARRALRQIQHKAKSGEFPYPELLKLSVDKMTRFEFEDAVFLGELYTDRGRVRVAKAEKGAVGEQCGFMHVTEFSRVARPWEFWDAAWNSMPEPPILCWSYVESTALETGPVFLDEFTARYDKEEKTGIPPSSCAVFVPSYIHHSYRWPPELVAKYGGWKQFYRESNDDLYGEDEYERVNTKWLNPFTGDHEYLPLSWYLFRRYKIETQIIPAGNSFTKEQVCNQSFPMKLSDAALRSTKSVFPPEVVRKRESLTIPAWLVGEASLGPDDIPSFYESPRGRLHVWQRPLPYAKYITAWDIAGGTLRDKSVGVAWCPGSKMLCAMWRSSAVEPTDLPQYMIAMARWFNNALLPYEANIYGPTILPILTGRSTFPCPGAPYENLYSRPASAEKPYAPPSDRVGFWTTDITKIEGQALLSQRFQDLDRFDKDGKLIYKGTDLWSAELFKEAAVYERKVNEYGEYTEPSPNARKGHNDDILRALEIALKAEQQLHHEFHDTIPEGEETDKEKKDFEWLQARMNEVGQKVSALDAQRQMIETKMIDVKAELSDYDDIPLIGGFD